MTNFSDFEHLPEIEINALINHLHQLKAKRVQQREKKALQAIKEIAKQAGLSPEQVTAQFNQGNRPVSKRTSKLKTKGKRRSPKYRSPDGKQTWAGTGHQPTWLQEALNRGAKIEDFLINDAAD